MFPTRQVLVTNLASAADGEDGESRAAGLVEGAEWAGAEAGRVVAAAGEGQEMAAGPTRQIWAWPEAAEVDRGAA